MQPFFGAGLLMWLAALPVVLPVAARARSAPGGLAFLALAAGAVLLPFTTEPSSLYEVSVNGSYNRHASALLLVLSAWAVLPGKRRGDAWILAWILVLLFALKFTAFLVALGLLAVRGAAHGPTREAAWGVAAALALLAVEASTRLVSAYLADILDMVRINRGRSVYFLGSSAYKNALAVVPLAALAATLALQARAPGRLRPRGPVRLARALARRHLLLLDVALVAGAALAAESQNTGGLSLLPACALLLRPGLLDGRSRRVAVLAGLAGFAAAAPALEAWTLRSLGLALRRAGTYVADPEIAAVYPGARIHAQALAGAGALRAVWRDPATVEAAIRAGYRLESDGTGDPTVKAALAEEIAAAAEAARRAGLDRRLRRATTLDFADPFPRMLGLAPAPGLRLVLDPGRTVGDLSPEEASRYLAGVDGVFAPLCAYDEKAGQTRAMFEAALAREFERVPLTPCWEAYRRR